MSPRPTHTIRRATPDDGEALHRLHDEAFANRRRPREWPDPNPPGRTTWVAVDDASGAVVAKLVEREYESWFGGEKVPTAGIGGVVIRTEERGRGLVTPLIEAALGAAHERGAVVSTLFPTAPGIYRKYGYELIVPWDIVKVPTDALAAVRPPHDGEDAGYVARATAADVPQMRALYERWAQEQNGPLTRTGPNFTTADDELVSQWTGVTLARRPDGELMGYAMWDRTAGYGPEGLLQVHDLLATSGDGYKLLLRALGTHATIAPTTRLRTSGWDPVRMLVPAHDWAVIDHNPYMASVLDIARALGDRSYAPGLTFACELDVPRHVLPAQAGRYRFEVTGGQARCERTGDASSGAVEAVVTLTPTGLAQLYAGSQSCANLRFTGGLTGPTAHDSDLDAAFGGRMVSVRDYF